MHSVHYYICYVYFRSDRRIISSEAGITNKTIFILKLAMYGKVL